MFTYEVQRRGIKLRKVGQKVILFLTKTKDIKSPLRSIPLYVPFKQTAFAELVNKNNDKQLFFSAAHCAFENQRKPISEEKYFILLGKLNIRSWCDDRLCQTRRVSKLLVHPDYIPLLSGDREKKLKADLAVFVLNDAVVFNKYIIPICLWSERNTDLDLIVHQKGTVAGWGKDEKGEEATPEPKKISIPIVSQEHCFRSNDAISHLISNTTFCAGMYSF